MNLKSLFENYEAESIGMGVMNCIDALCEYIEEDLDDYDRLCKEIHETLYGDHYNEALATAEVERLCDPSIRIPKQECKRVYEGALAAGKLPDKYNEWDFYVAVHHIRRTYNGILTEHFSGDIPGMAGMMAAEYLADDRGTESKIWDALK